MSGNELVKIEYRCGKRSHKLDGIGVGRIRTFQSISSDSVYADSVAYDPVTDSYRSRKQKRKNQPIARPGIEHFHWFVLPLLLATPTKQFSLDRKRRSHNALRSVKRPCLQSI